MIRLLFALALAAALACGTAKKQEGPCVPADCAALGASCGAVGDGCGGVLECGECAAGTACGAGGQANVCGTGTCQPAPCPAEASCGSVGDGCGGTLDCGTCQHGETCGGGGQANVCGLPACEKATCAAKGATCGTIPDGCGGELACGECGDGKACGAGGTPNVCAPIPPTGDVAWAVAVSSAGFDRPVGAGNDSAGNRYLLTFTPNEMGTVHTLRLQKLAPDGKLAWTREWAATGFAGERQSFRLAVPPSGGVYVGASADCSPWATRCIRSIDFGGGAATDSVVAKLGADGAFLWQRELAGTDLFALSANASGNVLVARIDRFEGASSRLEKLQHDGTLLATVEGFFQQCALDPSGNMIGAGPGIVAKYSASGALVWQKALAGTAQAMGMGTTAKGTVVLLAQRTGDVSFGSSQIRSGSLVLLVLEADGRERFARGFGWSWPPSLAVDPTGRAAVVGGGGCGEVVVEAFDLANADLWRRFLPDGARCWAGMGAGPAAYGADHRLFVTGTFATQIEVDGTTYLPRGTDAIGVLLDP